MLDETQVALIRALADGAWRSGSALAADLGISRSAVWKRIRRLEELGLDLEAAPRRGYRFPAPLDLLDRAVIENSLGDSARQLPLLLCASIDSSNRVLMAAEHARAICLCEHQSAGRGRRGRDWYSPYGANLYLSVLWTYGAWPPGLQTLGLELGLRVASVLRALDFPVDLKWPNDLYARGRKLGGLLIEQRGEQGGACRLVAGLGLNLRYRAEAAVGQPWTALDQLAAPLPPRSELAARLVNAVVDCLAGFRGLRPELASEFARYDAFRDREVTLSDGIDTFSGIAAGIDDDGQLRLRGADGERRFASGDLSLRAR